MERAYPGLEGDGRARLQDFLPPLCRALLLGIADKCGRDLRKNSGGLRTDLLDVLCELDNMR